MARRSGVVASAALWLALAPAVGAEELSVVSYNVHGLPSWIARDDPAARMPEIGRLLKPYDVSLVQEVWGYQKPLAASVGLPTELVGNGPREGALRALPFLSDAFGAGLSVFAQLAPERVLAVAAEPYDLCADWIFGANDCFATKGFVFARMRLASGAEIDFYDTHLEAGDGADDLAVREAQLEKLATFVEAQSAGRAVVLGGDLNLDFDGPHSQAIVAAFSHRLGLHDANARPADRSRWKNRIDWILYRSAENVTLEVQGAGEDRAFERGGVPLSDHPAVFARFRVATPPGSGGRAGGDAAVHGDHGARDVGARP